MARNAHMARGHARDLFIYLFVLYVKAEKHQIHKTVFIRKYLCTNKVTIYTI